MKLLFIIVISFFSGVSGMRAQYLIEGLAPETYNGQYVYMAQLEIDAPMAALPTFTDSAIITDGKFIFKGVVDGVQLNLICLEKASGSLIALIDGKLEAYYVDADPKGYFKISGTPLNKQLTEFIEYPMLLAQKLNNITLKRQKLLNENEWTMDDEQEMTSIMQNEAFGYINLISQIVKENIENAVGQYILVMSGGSINKDVMSEIEPKLNEQVKQKLEESKALMANMMKMSQGLDSIPDAVQIGKQYTDFEAEIVSGDKLLFSSVIESKKLVLLDFWASWCLPCLKEMPEVVALYEKYKDKGFEVVGVSIDNDRIAWKNMIDKKEMGWYHFIDSDISNLVKDIYAVKTIPHTILIDEKGTIVARNLRGEELKAKIEELLN